MDDSTGTYRICAARSMGEWRFTLTEIKHKKLLGTWPTVNEAKEYAEHPGK